jgi:hypothetical protein
MEVKALQMGITDFKEEEGRKPKVPGVRRRKVFS